MPAMWKKKLEKLLKNMTQMELAAKLDLGQPYISQLLNGDVSNPSYAVGQRIDALIARMAKARRKKPKKP